MAKEKEFTETLPVRMSKAERPLIRKAAVAAELSESRYIVAAALLLSDFGTAGELHDALRVGHHLVNTRLAAVTQVRMVGNQLKLLRDELAASGQAVPEVLEEAVNEVSAALKNLGAGWRAASAK
jgi:hypothetical protein